MMVLDQISSKVTVGDSHLASLGFFLSIVFNAKCDITD